MAKGRKKERRSKLRSNHRKKERKMSPLQVTQRRGESIDRMIRRFSKKVREDGILSEFMSRTYFEKPSVVRRRKRSKARWNALNASKK
jgi:small subunit ribosomal protein S21